MKGNTNTKKVLLKYGLIVGILLGVFALTFFTFYLVTGGKQNEAGVTNNTPEVTAGPNEFAEGEGETLPEKGQSSQGLIDDLVSAPRKTNFLILGLDQSTLLCDVNIVGSFDSFTGKIDLISVPRDTKITVSKEDVEAITAMGRYIPPHGVMKLTDLHSYAGREQGHAYSQNYIEQLLDIKIDFYVEVDITAFRYIVDTLGGIWVDIPKGGLRYTAPDQSLYINLPEGRTKLDGKQAEHYVRYRGYANADLGRIQAQQNFLKELFSQILDMDEVMNNPQLYVKTFINYVKTDFPATEITKYLGSIAKFKTDSIAFHVVPGEPKNEPAGSYFYQDDEAVKTLLDETFNNYEIGLTDTQKNLNIRIENGGNTDEFCKAIVVRLKAAGYDNVSFEGAYEGSVKNETRIMLKKIENAELLENYFANPKIEIDAAIQTGTDVIVIIGKNEK